MTVNTNRPRLAPTHSSCPNQIHNLITVVMCPCMKLISCVHVNVLKVTIFVDPSLHPCLPWPGCGLVCGLLMMTNLLYPDVVKLLLIKYCLSECTNPFCFTVYPLTFSISAASLPHNTLSSFNWLYLGAPSCPRQSWHLILFVCHTVRSACKYPPPSFLLIISMSITSQAGVIPSKVTPVWTSQSC